MATIIYKQIWQLTQAGVYDADAQIYYDQYNAETWTFDTVTRTTRHQLYPDGGSHQFFLGFNELPEDVNLLGEIFGVTSGPSRTSWEHDGAGVVTEVLRTLQVVATPIGCDCYGQARGIIDLVESGLPGPYTYLWSDGSTLSDRTQLPAGTYQVTVTATPSGAARTVSAVIRQNPRLEVVVQKTDALVTLAISGGVAPYTVLWSDGDTRTTRADLVGGASYSFTVTDSLGCEAEGDDVSVNSFLYYFAGNPITLALDAGDAYRDDPTTKPNLTFACEVYLEQEYFSGTFTKVGTVLEQPADREGRTVFEVQNLLRPYLQYHVPAPGAAAVELAAPLFRRFYLQYAEVYGEPPVRAAATTLTNHYVLLGGLDFLEASLRTWWNGYQDTVMPFLTWEGQDKPAADDQPEFLYHQVLQAGDVRVRVRATLAGGDVATALLGSYAAARRYEVLCIPCGFAVLRGLFPLAGQIEAWEVWVESTGGVPRSERRRYVRDRRPAPHGRRYFLYANSLGGMNTCAATGEALYDTEATGEEVELALPPGYDPALGDTAVLDRTVRPVLKWATGLLPLGRRLPLQELQLSRRVLLLSRDGASWRAGYLKAKTLTLEDESKQGQKGLELEFYLPRQRYFTPPLPAVLAGQPAPALPPYASLLP